MATAAGVLLWWRTRPPLLDVAVVTEGPLEVLVREQGTTRVRGAVVLSAPVAGRWVPAALDPGDLVRAGTLVGTLHAVPLDATALAQAVAQHEAARAAVADAEAQHDALRVALEEARRTLHRVERLEAAGALAPEALEQARTAVATRQDALAGAAARVASAHAAQRGTAAVLTGQGRGGQGATRGVVAPRAGTVLRLLEEQERVLPAGTPLVRVGDLAGVEVVVELLSSDAGGVRPGTAVACTVGSAPRTAAGAATDTLRGTVVRVEPAARPVVSALGVEERRVRVVATLAGSPHRLGDGHALECAVVLWRAERVTRLPVAALQRADTGWTVLLVRRGRARAVPVAIGARGEAWVQVRAGVQAGDSVVRYPGVQ